MELFTSKHTQKFFKEIGLPEEPSAADFHHLLNRAITFSEIYRDNNLGDYIAYNTTITGTIFTRNQVIFCLAIGSRLVFPLKFTPMEDCAYLSDGPGIDKVKIGCIVIKG